MITIEPRGANLDAVTAATRSAAEIAAIGGYIAQVWTWRGGEAVVVREWALRGSERWVVIAKPRTSAATNCGSRARSRAMYSASSAPWPSRSRLTVPPGPRSHGP